MFKLFKIDLLDTFIYADIFEEEKYTLLAQSDNLENLVQFAMSEFKSLNKQFKSFQEWQEEAEDGGYEVEIFHDASYLFRGSMLLLDPMIEKAMNLALKYHKNVKRKGDGLPYIIHISMLKRNNLKIFDLLGAVSDKVTGGREVLCNTI